MSLRRLDVDRDGDEDVVYSDRKGDRRSVGWLENPGRVHDSDWKDHLIGGRDHEVMFLDIAAADGKLRIACNTRDGCILDMTPTDDVRAPWKVNTIAHPPNAGAGKAVALVDINQNGRLDLVCTCGLAAGKFGVFWLEAPAPNVQKETALQSWIFHLSLIHI